MTLTTFSMANKTLTSSGLYNAILQELSDGEWHDLEALTSAVGPYIIPETASRAYLRHSHTQRWPTDMVGIKRALRIGRRCTVIQALLSLQRPRKDRPAVVFERRTGLRNKVEAVRLVKEAPCLTILS